MPQSMLKRVITAIALVWGIAILAMVLIGCMLAPLLPASMAEGLRDYLEVVSDARSTPAQIEAERDALWAEFGTPIAVQYLLQWGVVALATYGIARRTARQAESREVAVRMGLWIGLGVILSYGTLCACLPAFALAAPALLGLGAAFLGIFVAAGLFGGRQGAEALSGVLPMGAGLSGAGSLSPLPYTPDLTRAETYYQMGVQAALGGRREEARQHFTRVLQADPRSVPAWLQLANLADTPEQAWNYVQQARALSPNDPAVQQAVAIIWPQVAQQAARHAPPRNQPPYPGGQIDDVQVPRSRLPDLAPPPTIAPPPPRAPQDPPALVLDALQQAGQSDVPPAEPGPGGPLTAPPDSAPEDDTPAR